MPFTCSEGRRLTVGSLFSGIGGFDLGMERAGCEVVWQVEIDPFCRRVLEKHWPGVPKHDDIRTFNPNEFVRPDIIVGGFPCQPFSLAGQRRGADDDRHLWPEMRRLISELRPAWIIGENVAGIIGMALDGVLSDLEDLGYTCRTFVIPACAVGAPHRRDRVWIVAHADTDWKREPEGGIAEFRRRTEDSGSTLADATCKLPYRSWHEGQRGRNESANPGFMGNPDITRLPSPEQRGIAGQAQSGQQPGSAVSKRSSAFGWNDSEWIVCADGAKRRVKSRVRLLAHGIPGRVARLKALGNSVVPQIPEAIGHAILASMATGAIA